MLASTLHANRAALILPSTLWQSKRSAISSRTAASDSRIGQPHLTAALAAWMLYHTPLTVRRGSWNWCRNQSESVRTEQTARGHARPPLLGTQAMFHPASIRQDQQIVHVPFDVVPGEAVRVGMKQWPGTSAAG